MLEVIFWKLYFTLFLTAHHCCYGRKYFFCFYLQLSAEICKILKIIFYVISNSAWLLLWKEIFLLFLPSAQCRNLQDLNLSECSGVTVRTDNSNDYNDDNCYYINCCHRHFLIIFNDLSIKSLHKVVQKVLLFQRRRVGSHYFPYVNWTFLTSFWTGIFYIGVYHIKWRFSLQVKIFLADWSYSSVFR